MVLVLPEPVGPTRADVAQHRDAPDIAEGDVAELDRAVDARRIQRARLVLHLDRHVQHLEDPLT
jgi:hypothetical protein